MYRGLWLGLGIMGGAGLGAAALATYVISRPDMPEQGGVDPVGQAALNAPKPSTKDRP
ncbi:hypothetical protein LCGC14_2940040, partial [marine sediment metagenome]